MPRLPSLAVCTFFLLLLPQALWGHSVYSGSVGAYPIELILEEIHADGFASAIYTYTKFDTPISLDGKLTAGVLRLDEKNMSGAVTATLVFDPFDTNAATLNGYWRNVKTKKQLPIQLSKVTRTELRQRTSLKKHYFTVQPPETADETSESLTVKIRKKGTDTLVQELSVEAQCRGLDCVSVGDYNFDGAEDFSVFEASYAGANTSSFYFLYNPKTRRFFDSGFTGTSLEFKPESKTIHERNACCGGSIVTTATYKVENNKMVPIQQQCYKWDEEKEALTERKMKACE